MPSWLEHMGKEREEGHEIKEVGRIRSRRLCGAGEKEFAVHGDSAQKPQRHVTGRPSDLICALKAVSGLPVDNEPRGGE